MSTVALSKHKKLGARPVEPVGVLNVSSPLSTIRYGNTVAFQLLTEAHRVGQAAQHSQGIQTLLEAEKEAAKIVQQARQCMPQHPDTEPTFLNLNARSCTEAKGRAHGG